jgi:two-component system, OmpR family, alkaline phosphatase synthesis response regulator PhoP
MDEAVIFRVEANHELVIGLGRHEVRVDGQPVDLLPTEYRVLQLLARSPGRTFSRTEILDGLHGQLYAITPRAVDGQIVGLRRKLGPAAGLIETVRGAGYRFKAAQVDDTATEAANPSQAPSRWIDPSYLTDRP